ncbi:MAG: RHS repeat-associated core domain-containing protein [Acidobacteriota bacterium]
MRAPSLQQPRENTKITYDSLDVMDDDAGSGLTTCQNGFKIDSKLKEVTDRQAKYFLQDHLGSTIGLSDSNQNLTSSASYDSFGNSTNSLSTRYQYTGREYDNFFGLYYYRARWYDQNLGRFISEDPIGFRGGINLFGYEKMIRLFIRIRSVMMRRALRLGLLPDQWRGRL